jgi:hypothetical protein
MSAMGRKQTLEDITIAALLYCVTKTYVRNKWGLSFSMKAPLVVLCSGSWCR